MFLLLLRISAADIRRGGKRILVGASACEMVTGSTATEVAPLEEEPEVDASAVDTVAGLAFSMGEGAAEGAGDRI